MVAPITPVEMSMDELEGLLQRAKGRMSESDYQKLEQLAQSYAYVVELVGEKDTTIRQLRKLLFGDRTEKLRNVVKEGEAQGSGSVEQPGGQATATENSSAVSSPSKGGDAQSPPDGSNGDKAPPPGHGRHPASAYWGAVTVPVPHATHKPSGLCPCCKKGKLYEQARPGVIVRLHGQAPVGGKVFELEKLRCNLCGEIFTAKAPEGIGQEKFDASSVSIVGVLRYGNGMPFHRLDKLQGSMGIPLPASTQWDMVNGAAPDLCPAYERLIWEAAQGQVLHNDDTPMKVLELMGRRPGEGSGADQKGQRTGIFTSGIVSIFEGRRIALFFTGHQHAGENLAQVLARRAAELGPPIQMCDALSRNMPKELAVVLANCLAHGRRQFVNLAEVFPEPVRHVLEVLKEVYRIDGQARQQGLSPEERLALHQRENGQRMTKLQQWLTSQIQERRAEPNSSLGKAIGYMLKHWHPLTLFLRVAGAPLDNNLVERALKLSIRHRRASLFYRSERGAEVGDMYMSLIHTCQLNGVDAFDYLTQLQLHKAEVAADPASWMPWNYPTGGGGGRSPPASS